MVQAVLKRAVALGFLTRLSSLCARVPPAKPSMSYEQYGNRMRQIKNSATSSVPLAYWDIPWPPAGNCLFLDPSDDAAMKKRKLKDALLFWHADKFLAFCGSRLVEDQKEIILKRVNEIAQEVIQSRSQIL